MLITLSAYILSLLTGNSTPLAYSHLKYKLRTSFQIENTAFSINLFFSLDSCSKNAAVTMEAAEVSKQSGGNVKSMPLL